MKHHSALALLAVALLVGATAAPQTLDPAQALGGLSSLAASSPVAPAGILGTIFPNVAGGQSTLPTDSPVESGLVSRIPSAAGTVNLAQDTPAQSSLPANTPLSTVLSLAGVNLPSGSPLSNIPVDPKLVISILSKLGNQPRSVASILPQILNDIPSLVSESQVQPGSGLSSLNAAIPSLVASAVGTVNPAQVTRALSSLPANTPLSTVLSLFGVKLPSGTPLAGLPVDPKLIISILSKLGNQPLSVASILPQILNDIPSLVSGGQIQPGSGLSALNAASPSLVANAVDTSNPTPVFGSLSGGLSLLQK